MTALAHVAASPQVEPMSEQQLLHYADPYYDIRSGAFRWNEFGNQFLVFALGPLVLMFVLFGVGTFLMEIAGLGLAHRMARLEGTPTAVDATRAAALPNFYGHLAAVAALKLLVGMTAGSDLGGSVAAIYWLFSLYAAGRFIFHFRRDKLWAAPRAAHGRVGAAAVSIDSLRERRAVVAANLTTLSKLGVFQADTDAMRDAWAAKNTGRLESLMRDGDALTRLSWQKAFGVYNHAVQSIDAGRQTARLALAEADALLSRLGIAPAVATGDSTHLKTDIPIAAVQRGLAQKLNYTGGFAQVAQKVGSGQMPWQAAVAAAAFAMLMTAINESKLLRQLKELEGELTSRSAAAKGDIAWTETMIVTRLLPQLDGLLSLIDLLATEQAETEQTLDGASLTPAARAHAARLAITVAEGKRLLETMAGN